MVIRAYFIDSPDFMDKFYHFRAHPDCDYIYPITGCYSDAISLIEKLHKDEFENIIIFDNPLYLDIVKHYVRNTELYIDNYALMEWQDDFSRNLCNLYTTGHFQLPTKSHSWEEYVKQHGESQIVIPGNVDTYNEFTTLAKLLLIHKEWIKDVNFYDGYWTIYRNKEQNEPFCIQQTKTPYRLFHFPSSVMALEFTKTFKNELLTISRFV